MRAHLVRGHTDVTKREEQHEPQREVAGDGRDRERGPPLDDQPDRLLAEPHGAFTPRLDRGLAEEPSDRRPDPAEPGSDRPGERLLPQHHREQDDAAGEEHEADQRRHEQGVRGPADDREQRDRHDRETELQEHVPDAGRRREQGDLGAREPPRVEHPVHEAGRDDAGPRHEVRDGRRGLIAHRRLSEREPRHRRLHLPPIGEEIEDGGRDEREHLDPRQCSDRRPHIRVAGDLRQDQSEDRDHDQCGQGSLDNDGSLACVALDRPMPSPTSLPPSDRGHNPSTPAPPTREAVDALRCSQEGVRWAARRSRGSSAVDESPDRSDAMPPRRRLPRSRRRSTRPSSSGSRRSS